MNHYYLRIEGVNFDHFVLDTNHIKIIRGGSLMLLNSIGWLQQQIPALESITTGASWGLFRFAAKDHDAAGEMLGKVREKLNGPSYRHATFTLAVQPVPADDKDYPRVRDQLLAQSRRDQLRAPSLAIPSLPPAHKPQGACTFDKLRPATEELTLRRDTPEEAKQPASASVYARWQESGREREWFYRKRIGFKLAKGLEIVEDLDQLTNNPAQGRLNGKMAVIYLDGNHFGKLAGRFCTTERKQEIFDRTLRSDFQDRTLQKLMERISQDDAWYNGNRLRLETLLWGGDEIIWVAPAWRGWWLLQHFFELTHHWRIDGQTLTHGAGLVFCHHDAPIQSILALARTLGDLAKGDRTANRIAYQVLESFDYTGHQLEALRNRRWPLETGLVLDGNAMPRAEEAARHIKASDLPKRQLHHLAQLAFSDRQAASTLANTLSTTFLADETRKTLEQGLGSGLVAWLHLLELWDYLAPTEEAPS